MSPLQRRWLTARLKLRDRLHNKALMRHYRISQTLLSDVLRGDREGTQKLTRGDVARLRRVKRIRKHLTAIALGVRYRLTPDAVRQRARRLRAKARRAGTVHVSHNNTGSHP